jgi:hypothetical protein
MIIQILALWGCMPELTKGCIDMTNASSTYLSIAVGVLTPVSILSSIVNPCVFVTASLKYPLPIASRIS